MKIVLLGPPGAGKGTQAQEITRRFSVPQVATGDILRAAIASGSDIGRQVRRVMDEGALVSDELMLSVVQQRLQRDDCRDGCLFDGFPRTVGQAEGLHELGISVDWVVEIQAAAPALIQRLSGRRVHPGSGRTYHITNNPPKREGLDDVSGEPLVRRDDDSEATIARRLQVYDRETAPLVEFYARRAPGQARLVRVDGLQAVGKVTEDILAALSR